ncbi:MAG: TetR family transcriptional regulator [Alphaproteobacteria bacterium]|nr:MAG: TetR family transcriptional regulator [Alphaproteobacteria bacterium]
MAAPKGGTRERILNAAEQLFAQRGYDGASTRAIVAKSGDTIGSVNYHFGSKDKLLAEVIRRRWDEIVEARRECYAAARRQYGGAPPVEAVVEAIVAPYLERAMCGGRGWRSYALLQARVLYSEKSYTRNLKALSEPIAREFIGWLAESLPGADMRDLGYAYQFMIGAMVESCAEIEVNRISRITDGLCDAADYGQVKARLLAFISGGIRATVAADANLSVESLKSA